MRKSLLLLPLATLLSLTSCLGNGSDQVTSKFGLVTLNLITDFETETTTASAGAYMFNLDMVNYLGEVTTSNLVFNNTASTLITEKSPFSATAYFYYFKNLTGIVSGGASLPMNQCKMLVTPYYFPLLQTQDDIQKYNLSGYPYAGKEYNALASKYYLGNRYLVQTFQIDTFYQGTTTSTYPGGSATNRDIVYRLTLNLNNKTATMIMYNAKFSESDREPTKDIIINNLQVAYSQYGLTVTGQDIVPDMYEGGSSTPYENYIFKNIQFQTTGDLLTDCTLHFEVGENYSGTFIGSYIPDDIKSAINNANSN